MCRTIRTADVSMCRTIRTADATVTMMMMFYLSTRSAGDEGQGGTSRLGVASLNAVSIPAVGEEPEQDQSEEQLQAPLCQQHGSLPGGLVEETRWLLRPSDSSALLSNPPPEF